MRVKFDRLALIGCGLMGSSFALAARRAGLVRHVTGWGGSARTLQTASLRGALDDVADSAAAAVRDADLVLLAAPVAAIEDALRAIGPALPPQALIVDVASTKASIVTAAQGALGNRLPNFIPCHPMAGSDKSGAAHADAQLYRGCQVIMTPTAESGQQQMRQVQALWEALGCRITVMTPAAHDRALAAVSHLPHLLAFAFMDSLGRQPDGAAMLALAGPGFRDFSRIGGANARMWRDVLLDNREQVLAQTHHFRQALNELEQLLTPEQAPALQQYLERASATRRSWRLVQAQP